MRKLKGAGGGWVETSGAENGEGKDSGCGWVGRRSAAGKELEWVCW